MPRISAFYGIAIYMYWNEADHQVAHFHAHHGGRRASISVNGEVLAGSLEPRALALAVEWARLHRAELLANWERARRWEILAPIAPLSSHRRVIVSYLPAVVGVAVIGDHRLHLLFDDGTAGDVDFSSREWVGVFERLRDQSFFAQVRVDPEAATIVWPNGLDMAPEPLYEEAHRQQIEAARRGES